MIGPVLTGLIILIGALALVLALRNPPAKGGDHVDQEGNKEVDSPFWE